MASLVLVWGGLSMEGHTKLYRLGNNTAMPPLMYEGSSWSVKELIALTGHNAPLT